jgi:hypothetical protein
MNRARSWSDAALRYHHCERSERYELVDARGIFCCFACPKCEKVKRSGYRTDIFTDPDYWHDEPIDED